MLEVAVLQGVNDVALFVIAEALGYSLKRGPLEVASCHERLFRSVLLPGMILLVVVFDDYLAGTEECCKCGEYCSERVACGSRTKVALQIGTAVIGCRVCHYLSNDRQLVANELSRGVEELEVGL